MQLPCLATLFCFLSAAQAALAADVSGTRLLSQPALSEQHVAFVYDRDLWIADRNGQNPRRLTSHIGTEGSPSFSPDGSSIAFSAEYDGNVDVYIVSIQGGAPKRLTYHSQPDTVEGFTPDGKSVVFNSQRNGFIIATPNSLRYPLKVVFLNNCRSPMACERTTRPMARKSPTFLLQNGLPSGRTIAVERCRGFGYTTSRLDQSRLSGNPIRVAMTPTLYGLGTSFIFVQTDKENSMYSPLTQTAKPFSN